MKILVIINSGFATCIDSHGVENAVGEFANELQKKGHEIIFAQFAVSKNGIGIGFYDLDKNNIKYSALIYYKSRFLRYFCGYFKLVQILISIDFVYLFLPNGFKYLLLIAKLFRKPYGLYIRGMHGINNRLSQKLYRNAKIVLCVSEYFEHIVKSKAPDIFIETIKPMVNLAEEDIIRRKNYEKTDNYNLLYLGRLELDKGLFELLEMVKIFKGSLPYKFHLNIVGNGSAFDQLKEKVIEFKIDNEVTFFGALQNKQDILNKYREADLYILPTYHEGFPRTLYEAMVCGTPIVTTMVGGIPYLMKDGYNCFEIKVKSAESIVSVLSEIFSSYKLRTSKIVDNAYNTVIPIISKNRDSHATQLNKFLETL